MSLSDQHARSLLALSRYTGREVGAAFLREPREHCPEVNLEVIHSLAEGIFKPAGSPYALCVWSRSAARADTEVYPDQVTTQPDGTWSMDYAMKGNDPLSATNQSLFACMRDAVPLLVIVTTRPKTAPGGARYRIFGLAIIERFDEGVHRFSLRGGALSVAAAIDPVIGPEAGVRTYLQGRVATPFVRLAEPRGQYVASRDARDRAFRDTILDTYRQQCCVCQSFFKLREPAGTSLIEAQAAHIIPVGEQGPDDPRNGLSLCPRHHWAFDAGLFTVTDGRSVRVSPAVKRAQRQHFNLEEYDGERLVGASDECFLPAPEALEWHRQHRFRAA